LYTTQHPFDCGLDLHACAMYVCILNQAGETLLHRTMTTNPETCLNALAPYRDGLGVAVACLFTWYWLADLCAAEGIPCVLGHALSMQAIHGGKAKHDQIDSRQIAVLLRGGRLPQASVYPATLRAPRALRRRRLPLAHTRGELLAHGQHTTSPSNLPALGQKLASKAHRDGVAARFADPAGHKRIAVALALIGYEDELLRDVALPILPTAKHHDATTLYVLPTVPGIGQILSLGLLSDIHQIHRFPRGQELAAYGRLVQGAQESNGTRSGTSGSTMGHAHLQWAFAEAAVLCLRDHPAGQPCLSSLENKPDTGKALTIFAHTLARAVYDMVKRQVAFDRQRFLHDEGRGGGELDVSLAHQGMTLIHATLSPVSMTVSLTASERLQSCN
jgi:transposase